MQRCAIALVAGSLLVAPANLIAGEPAQCLARLFHGPEPTQVTPTQAASSNQLALLAEALAGEAAARNELVVIRRAVFRASLRSGAERADLEAQAMLLGRLATLTSAMDWKALEEELRSAIMSEEALLAALCAAPSAPAVSHVERHELMDELLRLRQQVGTEASARAVEGRLVQAGHSRESLATDELRRRRAATYREWLHECGTRGREDVLRRAYAAGLTDEDLLPPQARGTTTDELISEMGTATDGRERAAAGKLAGSSLSARDRAATVAAFNAAGEQQQYLLTVALRGSLDEAMVPLLAHIVDTAVSESAGLDAVVQLGKLGFSSADDVLERLVRDVSRTSSVRGQAVAALGKRGRRGVMLEVVSDGDQPIPMRVTAGHALLPPLTDEEARVLRSILFDEVEEVSLRHECLIWLDMARRIRIGDGTYLELLRISSSRELRDIIAARVDRYDIPYVGKDELVQAVRDYRASVATK